VHAAAAQLTLHEVVPSAWLFELVSAAFVEAARFCASVDPSLALPPLTAWELVAIIVVAASLMLEVSWRARGLVGVAALCVCGLSEWSLRRALSATDLRVTFLDVGQGDAALLETQGHVALIDAGGSIGGGPDPGALAVLPLLAARRITHLDWVVLSHPHPDHYGGLRAVLDGVSVGELWDNGQAEAEATDAESPVAQLLASAQRNGTRVRAPPDLCHGEHRLGSARVQVLAPCPTFDLGLGPNDNSFVLRVAHGARSFLFTGDIEHEAEAALTRTPSTLRSDVLKVPHHGSRTSSTEALLRAVAPSLAVVSAGRANRFGHPHPEVAARLAQHVERVLRTDQVGGVQVVSDGSHLTVTTALPFDR
jgi:competence protein ComEC